jgi:glutathione S-transferase
MMAKVQIIGAPQSSYVRTTLIVAEERGVDYENVFSMPHSPEVRAIHPLGKIPVMRHGQVELCESRAIAAYLDLTFPGTRLTPNDALAAARIEQWVSMFISTLQPVFGPGYIGGYFFPNTADGSPDRARIEANAPKVEQYLALLDAQLAKHGHLAGETFSLADAYLIPILFYLNTLPESGPMIAASASLPGYMRRLDARASIKATVPPPLPGREKAA